MSDGSTKPAYRFRKGVSWHEHNGTIQLLLSFPLKVVSLHPYWKPVLLLFSKRGCVPLQHILDVTRDSESERVERFLTDLSRKGFLDQLGISVLPKPPSISIILPVRNRPKEIEACLRSLNELEYPPEKLEVIVVDDASTDDTLQRASRFKVNLLALRQNRHASFCRNLAAKAAKGYILAFIDSDCVADPLWLKELTPAFKDPLVAAIGGQVDGYFSKSALDRYEKVHSPLIVSSWARRSSEKEKFFYVPSCNLLVRREIFLTVGGFKEGLSVGEDVDLCWRLQDRGWNIEFRPVGRVYHTHRNTLMPFCRRRFDYGTSEPLLQGLHPTRRKKMLFLPGAVLFWGIVALGVTMGSVTLLGCAAVPFLMEAVRKFVSIKGKGLHISFWSLCLSVLRGYFAFLYHCCSFVSRYYLGLVLVSMALSFWVSGHVLGAHLFTGLVQYLVKKPRLNPISFLFYFSLDQIFYQLGVWWGCLKSGSFCAVFPRPVMKAR